MKTKFKFDPKTGTMVPESAMVVSKPQPVPRQKEDVVEVEEVQPKPSFSKPKDAVEKAPTVNFGENIIRMKRTGKTTPIQLVDDKNIPETYLDSLDKNIVMFRERQDYDICQIADDKTGVVLAYIGGYALQMQFNMAELNSMERIEQCLQGISKLFRHKIMNQAITGKTTED